MTRRRTRSRIEAEIEGLEAGEGELLTLPELMYANMVRYYGEPVPERALRFLRDGDESVVDPAALPYVRHWPDTVDEDRGEA
ncbi:hypothetical protein SAMN04488063_0012 [Halopelagius inordinatus]|uniref:Uncharacterized protein n=1 Tax=Halopelagius inordinatus TaxID=553467 RepID=A0A1I2WV30_9EURY|nr:hypothetical protein [Halopelagius inordinatus]SFH05155.1 hypothetical protein SAMN04488063_0012 [Halopelagius inordinatus]